MSQVAYFRCCYVKANLSDRCPSQVRSAHCEKPDSHDRTCKRVWILICGTVARLKRATPYFSCCLRAQSGCRDPNFRVTPHPVFRGAGGRRSSPSARCSSYVPTTVSYELAAAEISASVRSLSFPSPNWSPWWFFHFYFFVYYVFFLVVVVVVVVFFFYAPATFSAGVKSTRRCWRRTQVFFAPCAAPPWQWIDFGVFFSPPLPSLPSPPADLRLEQVEGGKKENSSSNLRLAFSPARCFVRLPL